MFKKSKIIDMNRYAAKELETIVSSYIREYHGSRHRNKIFRELDKLEDHLMDMRNSGLSIEWIRQFLIDTYDYKIGLTTLSDYFKILQNK